MSEFSTYLIRLNGVPFFQITLPSYMDARQVAREVLLHGTPDGVTVKWSGQEQAS